jgi:hypothetical protein
MPARYCCRFGEIPAFRLRAFVAFPPRCRPAAPDLVRRLARRAQVPLADNDARKIRHTRSTSARNPATRLPKRRDDDHKTIKTLSNQCRSDSYHAT